DRQSYQQLGVDAVTHHVQPAIELQVTGRAGHRNGALGHEDAFGCDQLALDSVKAQALAEQIGEIQPQTPANGVEIEQAKHAQRLSTAIDFAKLTVTHPRVQPT